MRNRLLEPGKDFAHGPNILFCQIAVHVVAQTHVDSAVPQPANPDVDFAVIDFLKLGRKARVSIMALSQIKKLRCLVVRAKIKAACRSPASPTCPWRVSMRHSTTRTGCSKLNMTDLERSHT